MISPAAKPQPPLDRCRRRSKSRPRYWELHRTELTFATYSATGGLPALEPSVDLVFLVKFLSAGAMHRCGNDVSTALLCLFYSARFIVMAQALVSLWFVCDFPVVYT
jgi:hypothetical protein